MSLLDTFDDYEKLYNNLITLKKYIYIIIKTYNINNTSTIDNFYKVLHKIKYDCKKYTNNDNKIYTNVLTKLAIKFHDIFISWLKWQNNNTKSADISQNECHDLYDLYSYLIENDVIINIYDKKETNLNISEIFKSYHNEKKKKSNNYKNRDTDDNNNNDNDDNDEDYDDDDDDENLIYLEENILNCMRTSMVIIKSYYNKVSDILNCDFVIHENKYFDILKNEIKQHKDDNINKIISSIDNYLNIINDIYEQYDSEDTNNITKRLLSNVINQIKSNDKIKDIDSKNINDTGSIITNIIPILMSITSNPDVHQDIEKIKTLSENGKIDLKDIKFDDITQALSGIVKSDTN